MAKTCGTCSRVHADAGWKALPLKGYVGHVKSGGRMYAVELRNCACGSTLGLEVEVSIECGRCVVAPATIPDDATEET